MVPGITSGIVPPSMHVDPIDPTPGSGPSEFGKMLENAISQTENLQANATSDVNGLLNGSGVDVHTAAIAVQKADLSFELMMQVRNKVVQAYQDIAHMAF